MTRLLLGSLVLSSAVLVACTPDVLTNPHHESPSLAFAKGAARPASDPTATWYLPAIDAGLAVRSDGQFVSGGHSVYANGVCGVEAQIFAQASYGGAFDPAGDAIISTTTSAAAGRKGCQRRFNLVYPDGQSEAVRSFNRVRHMANGVHVIPVGETRKRLFIVNPGYTGTSSRCDRVIYGELLRDDGVTVGVGTDSVLVTRINARRWHVKSASAELSKAVCEKTGQIFAMPVDLIIESSADLPIA